MARTSSLKIARRAYAEMYGPTTGDRLRLADTDLVIEIEKDHTIYGEEVKFGGGKVIRDGMGQGQRVSAECADTVITNAVIVDHWGIVKADIGIKGGRIAGIGKAGNPDVQPGVTIVIGPGTEIIAGEGLIATAGGIDAITIGGSLRSGPNGGEHSARLDEYSDANIAFHQAIIRMSGCALLAEMTENLFIHMRAIRKITIHQENRAARSVTDHFRIIEALERRDAERAERLAREHTLGLAAHVEQHGDFLDTTRD